MRTCTLGFVLGSLGLLTAGPAMAAQGVDAASVVSSAKTIQINRVLTGATTPTTASLGSHCSDPWWELSGIQWATCMYLRSRQK